MDGMKDIASAKAIFQRARKRGFAALNDIFRAGSPPDPPLEGEYAGEFIGLDVGPGLNQVADMVTARWMPWKGKIFDPIDATGDNILSRDSLFLARIVWPLYRGYKHITSERYRAFAFRMYLAPGLADPDRQVLKLDYNLKSNPVLNVRRVLDELVQVDADFYLGKAHFKWWWGTWQLVAYFSLAKR